jgi:hypothetical protein
MLLMMIFEIGFIIATIRGFLIIKDKKNGKEINEYYMKKIFTIIALIFSILNIFLMINLNII